MLACVPVEKSRRVQAGRPSGRQAGGRERATGLLPNPKNNTKAVHVTETRLVPKTHEKPLCHHKVPKSVGGQRRVCSHRQSEMICSLIDSTVGAMVLAARGSTGYYGVCLCASVHVVLHLSRRQCLVQRRPELYANNVVAAPKRSTRVAGHRKGGGGSESVLSHAVTGCVS